jgi:hypothetical protein
MENTFSADTAAWCEYMQVYINECRSVGTTHVSTCVCRIALPLGSHRESERASESEKVFFGTKPLPPSLLHSLTHSLSL